MSRTSKSPRKVLVAAWGIAKETLPAYSHRFSPKKFTQHQLFACLVLKAFLKTDYRGLASCLCDSPTWCEAIELKQVPHWTTFQKAARRLLRSKPVTRLLDNTVGQMMGRKRRVPLAAIDSTGLESHHASRYFIRRRGRSQNLRQTMQYARYPKLGILVDCSNHLILGYLTDQGPKPDIQDLDPTFAQTSPRVRIEWLTADAGYDSESNHRLCRQQLEIRSLIPPKHGRPTDKPARGRYRRRMQTHFDKQRYGQRWQVETVVSMIKRHLGPVTSGRSYWSRRRTFTRPPQPKPIALLGAQRIAAILTNVAIPWLAAQDKPITPLLARLPPEQDNALVRQTAHLLFGRDHNPALYRHGLRQQGLLQIFHDFCLPNKTACRTCRLLPALDAPSQRAGLSSTTVSA